MQPINRKWLKTTDMAPLVCMSPISLTRKAKKDDGYLIKGIHYNQPGTNNSPFYWNVEKTLEAFENWGAPVNEGQSGQ